MSKPIGPATALVIVPFPTIEEANQWADKVRADYPAQPRLIVSPGRESLVFDPGTDEARLELCFEGGWRARSADSSEGVVVITRTDAKAASLSEERSDGQSRN